MKTKQLTSEESTKLAKELKLRPKTKQFADLLVSNPKISQTEAYLATHKTENRNAAKVEASKTLTKPNVQLYMDSHINKAKMKVIELVDSDKPDIALRASESILDRSLGKATVVTESNTYTDIHITLGTDKPQVVSEQ